MLSWVCGCMLVLGQSKLWPHDKPRACMLNMVCGCCRPSLCLLPLGRAALSDPDSVSLDHNLEPTATTHVVAATNLSHDNCDAMRLQNRFLLGVTLFVMRLHKFLGVLVLQMLGQDLLHQTAPTEERRMCLVRNQVATVVTVTNVLHHGLGRLEQGALESVGCFPGPHCLEVPARRPEEARSANRFANQKIAMLVHLDRQMSTTRFLSGMPCDNKALIQFHGLHGHVVEGTANACEIVDVNVDLEPSVRKCENV